jgi:hypothetical protein
MLYYYYYHRDGRNAGMFNAAGIAVQPGNIWLAPASRCAMHDRDAQPASGLQEGLHPSPYTMWSKAASTANSRLLYSVPSAACRSWDGAPWLAELCGTSSPGRTLQSPRLHCPGSMWCSYSTSQQ